MWERALLLTGKTTSEIWLHVWITTHMLATGSEARVLREHIIGDSPIRLVWLGHHHVIWLIFEIEKWAGFEHQTVEVRNENIS